MAQTPITKSIDVGSMFLMDMSVCESEPACDSTDTIPVDINSSTSNIVFRNHDTRNIVAENHHHETRPNHSMQTSIVDDRTRAADATGQMLVNLSSSFDIIASVINSDGQQGEDTPNEEHSATVAEMHALNYNREPQSYSSSGESFVDSSGTSLSASYTIGSEPGHEDRDSTTTREDSGVLDMKDLQDQLINSYDNEWDEKFHLHSQHFGQEKPISSNIIATNLINKSVNTSNLNNQQQQQTNYISSKHSHRQGKPTEGNDHHNHHNSHSKRSMSASVPIQVPVRQMKKDLNKMKLKLMKEELEDIDQNSSHYSEYQDENDEPQDLILSGIQQNFVTSKTRAWDDDDDDAFLEQEYNESHHNRYPLNFDDEHPRAGEDPMKLFASIQALAKSLHEDAELFGSLPPKRLLESPIRSIALV